MVPRPNIIPNNENNQSNQNIYHNINNVNNNNINPNNINNLNNNHNSNILYHTNIYLNIIAENSNNYFIILFYPNKIFCIILLLLNILISGLGTIIIGFKNCSLYDFILGIIQFFGCYLFLSKGLSLVKTHIIFNIKVNSFLGLYLFIIALLFYLSSIYVGIFHNFIFFNPRISKLNENKEKGIFILFLNFITGGLGTILYGFLLKNEDCFNRIKIWIIGLVQISGFIIFIFAFSLINIINKIILVILFFIGSIGYITSICIGIKCYKKISKL